MLKLKNRTIDDWGNVIFDANGVCQLLKKGKGIDSIISYKTNEYSQFFDLCNKFDIECPLEEYVQPSEAVETYDANRQNEWFIPDEYKDIDVLMFVLNKCQTEEEFHRVMLEFPMFEQRHMIEVLRFMIYFVDYAKKNNLLIGIGRGSCVSSLILYLIGVHKVHPLEYDLDIKDFLK